MRTKRFFIRLAKLYLFSHIIATFSKVQKNKVLFLADTRVNSLDGNLLQVYDYIKDENYNIVIKLKDNKESLKSRLKLYYDLETSKYILLDNLSYSINFMKVRKAQEIVQLWHGPGAMKKFGYSRPDGEKYKKKRFAGHKNYTKAIVTSPIIKECFAEAFDLNLSQIESTGFPRTDVFFDKKYIESEKKAVYKDYPYLKNKKVILFAPTYRGDSTRKATYDFGQLDLDKMYKELGNKYIFIFKWHRASRYNILSKYKDIYHFEKYNGFYQDLSDENNINRLLLVTDILITDYSSVIFDYLLVNKPIVYFTYDLEQYKEKRGLYYPFEDYIYGLVANNQNELISAIKKEDMQMSKRDKFNKKFMISCDGNSTKKTCTWIFSKEGDNYDNKKNKRSIKP